MVLTTALLIGLSADRNRARAQSRKPFVMTNLAHPVKQPQRKNLLRARRASPRPSDVAFVRPGLRLQIQKVEVAAPNVVVTFRLSDNASQGLDRLGVNTPGPVNVGFTLARIKPGDQQYTSYYTPPPTGITQPKDFTDQGGTYESLGDGVYRYTMAVKLPSNYEVDATHTLGMWASRNLQDFDMGVPNANAVFDFVPSGTPVKQVRDIVRTEACNQCHDQLAAHG
jgi:hypothetical protein